MKKKFLAMLMCLCMALALTPTGVSAYDGTNWQSDDQIGISMLEAGTDTVSKDAKNRMYSYSDNDGFTPSSFDQGISYPLDGSDVDFHAYYPYNYYVRDDNTISYDLYPDQSSQSAIDLMYASTDSTEEVKYNKNNTKVDLNFTPQLAKIQVNLTCDESDISFDGAVIKITNQISTGNFNILNGQLTRGSDSSTDITLNTTRLNYGRAEAGGLLLPTNADNPIISGRKIILKLASGEEAEYDIPDNQKFIAGNTTTINLQLSATIDEGTSTPEEAHLTLLNDISSVKREGISTTLDSSGNIAPGEITRTSNSNATVKFTATGMEKYSYAVVNSGADEPLSYADIYDCDEGENTITLTNLAAGAQDIYIEGSGKFGINKKIKMTIPAYIPDTYTITYDANGGTSTMADGTATEDVPFTLPACGFTAPSGKQFKSWAIGSTTGTTINSGSTHTFTGATTVYAIWEDIPTYTITSSITKKNFGSKNAGYSTAPAAQEISITNEGNQNVTLSKNDLTSYTVSDFPTTAIAPGTTAKFTVKPNTSLTAGTYNETLIVSTGNNTSVNIELEFNVNGAFSASVDPESKTITNGDIQQLTANPTGGSGTYTYKWYKGNATTEFATTKEVTVSPSTTTTYKVVVNDGIEDATTTATITVNPKTYEITYDANGGTSTMTKDTATEEIPFTLPTCGFTAPSGKRFKSWAIGSTTGTTVNAGSKYTFREATTVYAIWEDIPTYTIASDKAYKEFKANLGYSDITPETFTITNTGNQTVTLSKNSSSIFDISDFSKTTLAPNDTATFTVKPILGLKKGVSIDALDISTGNETHVYIDLGFVVNDALSVKIDPASTTITNGDSKTLTANPTGGNGNYTYKWYKGNEATEFATTKEVTVSPNTTTTYKVVVNDTIEDKNTTSTITVNLKKYEITYDANGGTNTMTADIATEGEEFTLPACGFTAPLGKQFKSWAIGSADSKITVDAGEKYTFTTDKTVYPVWQAIQYKLIEGKDQTVIAGERKDLTFKIDAPLELLDKVYINAKELDENNYTTASGSTIITLKMDYVSTLTAGDYILKTTYTNGTSVETTFTVKAKETTSTDPMKPVDTNNTPNKNNVSTGDNSHITLWTGLLSISGLIGLVYVVLRKKRRVD